MKKTKNWSFLRTLEKMTNLGKFVYKLLNFNMS